MTNQMGGGQPDTAPRPGIVLPTPSSTVSLKYHIHQNSLIRPLAFPNHQLHNLLPLDTWSRNGAAVQPTPRGTWPDEEKKCQEQLNLQKKKKRKTVKVKKTIKNKQSKLQGKLNPKIQQKQGKQNKK